MATTQPIRDEEKVLQISNFYFYKNNYRDYLLIVMGVHTALRISDLLRLKWKDVYDFKTNRFRSNISLVEQKTQKSQSIWINAIILHALNLNFHLAQPESYLFPSRKGGALGRVQAFRIINHAAKSLKFEQNVSVHSLRKTFGYHVWKNGVPLAVQMEIYNHSHFRITHRYLGIDQDDKNEVFEKLGKLFQQCLVTAS